MKVISVLFFLLSIIFNGFSQRGVLIDSHQTVVITEKRDSAFFEPAAFYFEVKDFVFDSCHYSQNSFSVTFQIHNKTKHTFNGSCSSYISWYDAVGFRQKGSEPLFIKPDERKTVTLEVVAYHKTKMNNTGNFFGRLNGQEMYLPLTVKYSALVKKCGI